MRDPVTSIAKADPAQPPDGERPPADPHEVAAPKNLGKQAVSGVFWQGISFLGGKLLILVATAILARLLDPSEFGVVGLALVFIGIADVVSDMGVAQALIYRPASRRLNDAALVCSAGFGLLLAVVGVVTAPAVAHLFGNPEVTPLFRVLSLALFIGSIASVPEALLIKELQFRRGVLANLSRAATNGVVSVVLALSGVGSWALVMGQLASVVVYNVVIWSLVDYKPALSSLNPGKANCRNLISFGLPTALAMLLSKLAFDVDYIIIGTLLTAKALGFYSLAFRIPEMAIINVFYVLATVSFPIYARASGDRKRLASGYLTSLRLQSAFGLTAAAMIAASAPLLVDALFSDRWQSSVVPLIALAIYAGLRSLSAGAVEVYKALGKPRLAVYASLLRIVVLVPALLVSTHWGIVGVAWGQAIVAGVFVLGMQGLATHVLGIPLRKLLASFLPAVVASASAVVGVLVIRWSCESALPDSVCFALALLTGTAGALAMLRLCTPKFLADTIMLVTKRSSGART
jgi:lipopolysaccharide exporter